MKRIFTNCVIVALLFIFSMSGRAQSDVTSLVLKNAGFDENIQFKLDDALTLTTSYNNTGYDYYQMQDVEGWDHALDTSSGINACGATYAFGSQSTINNVMPPATNYNDGTDGGCLGFSSGWTAQVGYAQSVVLPPGSYTIECAVYNNNPTATAGTSLFGWIPDGGTAVMTTKTSFAEQAWETDAVSFTLTDMATGKIQVGIGAANVSSNSIAKIFIDYVHVACTLDIPTIQSIYNEGLALYGDGSIMYASDLKAALDGYAQFSGQTDFSPELFAAAINLCTEVKFVRDINMILDLLDEAQALINGSHIGYSQAAMNALEATYTAASDAYDNGLYTISNIQTYLDQLQSAYNIAKASYVGMKIQYKFNNVTGNTVTNTATGAAGFNFDGTLYNDASVIKMGNYNVLSLGNGTGYLDMGTNAGYVLPGTTDYTVSVYYRVDKNATISGAGNFLWSFSTSNACSQTVGTYAAYRLNAQIYMLTNSGYGSEQSISLASPAAQDGWHNLVYRQEGTSGELLIDGLSVGTNLSLSNPNDVFTSPSLYNWIGRSPYTSDAYLKNTLVYDFEFYNQYVPDPQISTWAAVVPDLDNAYSYGSVGDFSQLSALIAQYNSALASFPVGDGVGQYSQDAVDTLKQAIADAQALVDENKVSQFLIDDEVASLTAAYNTFIGSVNSAAVYPVSEGADTPYDFEPGMYYIQIGDYYLTVPEDGVSNTYLQLREYIDNPDKLHNNQVWNIRYNYDYSVIDTVPPMPLYSFVSDSVVWDTDGTWHLDELCRMKKGDTPTAQSSDGSNWSWRCHQIFYNGTAFCITANSNSAGVLSNALIFPNETLNEQATNASLSQKVFNVVFRTIDDVVANPARPTGIETPKIVKTAKIYGAQGEIVVSGVSTGDKISVYDISGRLVRTVNASSVENRCSVTRGLYIVKVSGQTPAVGKVIVQ